jgi:hypothetical protein
MKTASFLIDPAFEAAISQYRWYSLPTGYLNSPVWVPRGTKRPPFLYQHRLVFELAYGHCPDAPLSIDHINRDRSDNRVCNLRPATPRLQQLNRPLRRRGVDLPRGVRLERRRFVARMNCGGRYLVLGKFDTPEEASAAYELRLSQEIEQEIDRSWVLFFTGRIVTKE